MSSDFSSCSRSSAGTPTRHTSRHLAQPAVASFRMDLRSVSEPKGDLRCPFCQTTLFLAPVVIPSLGCALCSKFSVHVDRRIYAFAANRLLSFGVTAPIANAFTEQLTLLKRFTLLKMSNCWTERQSSFP